MYSCGARFSDQGLRIGIMFYQPGAGLRLIWASVN